MIDMCGTEEQETADTSCAPALIMPACSALAPTMKPVTLCKKMIGVFLRNKLSIPLRLKLWAKVSDLRHLLLVAKANELSSLNSLLWIDDRELICDNANFEAFKSVRGIRQLKVLRISHRGCKPTRSSDLVRTAL